MSQSWFSRRREAEEEWDQPLPLAEEIEIEAEQVARGRPWLPWILRAALGLIALTWLGVVALTVMEPRIGASIAPYLELVVRFSAPLLLLAAVALLVPMLTGHWKQEVPPDRRNVDEARELAAKAAQSASRIAEAHAQLLSQTKGYASAADRSAIALTDALDSMAQRGQQLAKSTEASVKALASLTARMDAFEASTPALERRISELTETLACLGIELRERSTHLETRLKDAATAAEQTREQLISAGDSLADRLELIRDGAKSAGEELTGLSELSSARIDLTLDRVKTVLDATEARIGAQNEALTALVDRSNQRIASVSQESLSHFKARCSEIEAVLDNLDSRLTEQSAKSDSWLQSANNGAIELSNQFDALEKSAIGRTERLNTAVMELSGETRRLIDALQSSDQSSEQLIKRAEALLLVLDSGVRELDESLPGAIGRVEDRLATLRQRIAEAKPSIEGIEAVASAVVGRMEDGSALSASHARTLDDSLSRSQSALEGQKAQVEALSKAIGEAAEGMGQLSGRVGPEMVEALLRVRETADAAARKAHDAIMEAIPRAAAALGDASSGAMQIAVGTTVDHQLARLNEAAGTAVKTANDAATSLDSRIDALLEASETLERRLAGSARQIDDQDRELLSRRSGELIEMLNNRAIDVTKWLGHDITQGEWSDYLKGDQGIFVRRSVRLLGRKETREIRTLYRDDVDFAEHVNRYVHDFETLLKNVLSARDGSALAVTLLSSDLGKLYVGLAQASDRLRTS